MENYGRLLAEYQIHQYFPNQNFVLYGTSEKPIQINRALVNKPVQGKQYNNRLCMLELLTTVEQ